LWFLPFQIDSVDVDSVETGLPLAHIDADCLLSFGRGRGGNGRNCADGTHTENALDAACTGCRERQVNIILVEQMDHAHRATRERLVRVEAFIDLLREACARRTFPRD